MHTKFFSSLLLLCCCTFLTLQAGAQGVANRIVAARVRGEVFVTVKASSLRTPVQDNTELSQGLIVTTAKESSVVLVFSNGATVNLGAESQLDIEQFTQDPFSTPVNMATITEEPSKSTTKLTLTRGELVGKVVKLKRDQGSSFTVGTPVGAAGIRGTVFRVVYRPDGTGKAFFSVTVQVGEVEFNFNGVVNAPLAVTGNKEVSGEVAVVTDPATGVTTVSFAGGQTLTIIDASPESMAAIGGAVTELAQALFNALQNIPAPAPSLAPQADDVTPLSGRP